MEILLHVLRFSGMAAALLVGAYFVSPHGGVAPVSASAPGPEPTVFDFGKANPDCAEWTNVCQVCSRDANGAPQCSTPGIACTPGAMICNARKAK